MLKGGVYGLDTSDFLSLWYIEGTNTYDASFVAKMLAKDYRRFHEANYSIRLFFEEPLVLLKHIWER